MIYLYVILVFLLSVTLSQIIIPRILVVALKKRLFDVPDKRKIHTGAIPRLGGLSFLPTILFSLAFITSLRYMSGYEIPTNLSYSVVLEFGFFICGLTLLYLIGLKDDLIGSRYRIKLITQILVASMFPLAGLWINNLYGLLGIYAIPFWIGMPLTIFVVVFIINAINLIDGIDGLASGLSMVALGVLGLLYLQHKLWIYSMLAFSTLGVLVPFFYYNVFGQVQRGRKIFMGDTGSLTLGYILAFLAVKYSMYNPQMIPETSGAIMIAFSTLLVPMLDVVRVVFFRIRKGKHLFHPDRNHIHHKFLDMGFSPRRAMISILLLACIFSCLNIVLVDKININILVVTDIVIWTGINLWFNRLKKLKSKECVSKIVESD